MENVFILRSLTKMHAIPGIRIGYAVTSDMEFLEKMEQSRQPWSVSIPAQAAGMASLKERMRVKRTCDFTNRERIWMENELDKLGITHYPSDANFILMRSGINLYEKLKKQKMKSRLVLQVHDELLIEAYEPELDEVQNILKEEMEHAAELKVPLEIDMHTGDNWYEAK